jgi:hypothetical protein
MGQEGDIERLHHLRDHVIKALLDELRPGVYEVTTPDVPAGGMIIDQVISDLDHSELVICDVTLDSPSVFYELAIRHCLGRPWLMLRDQSRTQGPDAARAFDTSAYRDWSVDLRPEAVESARATLRDPLSWILEQIDAEAAPDVVANNPVLHYYKAPLTEVSAGAGLAFGYYNNLVKPVAQGLDVDDDQLRWDGPGPFTDKWWKEVRLHVFLPEDLDQAKRRSIAKLIKPLAKVSIPTRDRPVWLVAFPWRKGCGHTLRLVDIPTTMMAIEESVRYRSGLPEPPLSEYPHNWHAWQEFRRFRRVFERLRDIYPDQDVRACVQQYTQIEESFNLAQRIEEENWSLGTPVHVTTI